MFTRKQYMNNECTHDQYYDQFVNDWQISNVSQRIGKDRIINSNDEHFNDIPLKEWDLLGVCGVMVGKLREAGDSYTLGGSVCINKAAARQIKQANL